MFIESLFSTFGAHVHAEQSEGLKEALVRLAIELRAEKAERRSADLRQRPLKESLLAERGGSSELLEDSDSRPQLVMRGNQFLTRIQALQADGAATIMRVVRIFLLKRQADWDLLKVREAAAHKATSS